ncbi:transcriptional regulator, IclR family [Treponema primitia ZAS-2]|uniref:Transcriptional regulator, IclR family n=1 Tax=Treponema primitia (strain ATCC BAA-887 / DSM 12427 / ZAS-2) TaxID=545694 RepID=F5YNJ3_TREPZ|nr:IclR family transcriptional regulator [Treponema primitia]AEF85604.1 transcriptional regulator, IclR family [Treponema primitia ZAS-2]
MDTNEKVSAVARTMAILEILSKDDQLGVSEIARRSGLNKSTVFRFLSTLSQLGYVYRDAANDRYGLSLKLNALVGIRSSSRDILRYASSPLDFLAKETGETIHLAILEDGELVYLRKIESAHSLRVVSMTSSVGDSVPMYCTGLGKAILAWFSVAEQEKYIAHQVFTKYTETTIVDGPSLLKELGQIKDCGYAFDRQEHEQGVVCVAAPVFTSGQLPIAAVSIAGPSIRMREEILPRYIDLILSVTKEISEKLGTMSSEDENLPVFSEPELK